MIRDMFENMHKISIELHPRSQDILEAIETDQIGWFLPNMPQRVGVCIPSGCTVEDADTNYRVEQKNFCVNFLPTNLTYCSKCTAFQP